jgi:hypothetical protein
MLNLFNYLKTTLTISFICIFALNSCGIYKYSSAKDNPTNADDRIAKNMEEGKGFRLGNIGKSRGSGTFEFASSNPLWRAALEKLDFAPLNNVDYGGGIIITDWFSDGGSNEQIKITIRFLTNEIRSDSIDVAIHKKVCNTQNNCKITKIENTLNSEIRFAILKKAAQLEKQTISNKKEDKKNFKLPKNF